MKATTRLFLAAAATCAACAAAFAILGSSFAAGTCASFVLIYLTLAALSSGGRGR